MDYMGSEMRYFSKSVKNHLPMQIRKKWFIFYSKLSLPLFDSNYQTNSTNLSELRLVLRSIFRFDLHAILSMATSWSKMTLQIIDVLKPIWKLWCPLNSGYQIVDDENNVGKLRAKPKCIRYLNVISFRKSIKHKD